MPAQIVQSVAAHGLNSILEIIMRMTAEKESEKDPTNPFIVTTQPLTIRTMCFKTPQTILKTPQISA
jgi:hypothetical protein